VAARRLRHRRRGAAGGSARRGRGAWRRRSWRLPLRLRPDHGCRRQRLPAHAGARRRLVRRVPRHVGGAALRAALRAARRDGGGGGGGPRAERGPAGATGGACERRRPRRHCAGKRRCAARWARAGLRRGVLHLGEHGARQAPAGCDNGTVCSSPQRGADDSLAQIVGATAFLDSPSACPR